MAKTVKKCVICGNEFEARNRSNIYCSPECCSIRNQNKKKEKYANNRQEYIRFLYRKCLNSALKRGHSFELSAETFEKYINQDCYYCGDKIEGIGLDRIDSKIGYTKDNIVSCCRRCNIMKMTTNIDVFLAKIKQIHDHLKL